MSGLTLDPHLFGVACVVVVFVAICAGFTVGLVAHLADMDDDR